MKPTAAMTGSSWRQLCHIQGNFLFLLTAVQDKQLSPMECLILTRTVSKRQEAKPIYSCKQLFPEYIHILHGVW